MVIFHKNKRNLLARAFTLIELLVVIAVIGLLAVLAIISLSHARSNARDAKRLADVRQLQTAFDMYFDSNGHYPSDAVFNSGKIYFSSASSGTTTLLETIPLAPTPADNPCSDSDNAYAYHVPADGSTYALNFCLSKRIGNLPAGQLEAFPGGIKPAVSSSTPACTPQCDNISCDGNDGCGGTCGCLAGKECHNQSCQAHLFTAKVFGGPYENFNYTAYEDGQYFYIGGNMYASTSSIYGMALAKVNKATLAVERYQYIDSSSSGSIVAIASDNAYLYVGAILKHAGGFGDNDIWIGKFDKSDLSLISQKFIGGTGNDQAGFNGLVLKDGMLYLSGVTSSSGQGGSDCLVAKLDTDLNIVSQKTFGTTGTDICLRLVIDSDGSLYTNGTVKGTSDSGADSFLLKLDSSSLSLLGGGRWSNPANEVSGAYSTGLIVSENSIYSSLINNNGGGNIYPVIIKYDKSTLLPTFVKTINSSIIRTFSMDYDGSSLYIAGGNGPSSSSGENVWLAKYDPSDLSLLGQWSLGDDANASNDNFFDMHLSGGSVYGFGHTKIGAYRHVIMARLVPPFPDSSLATEPANYTWKGLSYPSINYSGAPVSFAPITANCSLSSKDSSFVSSTVSPTSYGSFDIYY